MPELYYVIGPSGSGKDSVMAYARERMGGAGKCVFAHRYITRDAAAGGENHVALTTREYASRLDSGLFAMAWESHGYRYGIGVEIELWLSLGLRVVVNGSREHLAPASERFPELVPVLVTVSKASLRQRLLSRGRESVEEIERRIRRGSALKVDHSRMVTISNDGPLEDAGDRFLNLIQGAGAYVVA